MQNKLNALRAMEQGVMEAHGLLLLKGVREKGLKEKELKDKLKGEFFEYIKQKNEYYKLIQELTGGIGIAKIKSGVFDGIVAVAKREFATVDVRNGEVVTYNKINRDLIPEDIIITNKEGFKDSDSPLHLFVINKAKDMILNHPVGAQAKMAIVINGDPKIEYRLIVDNFRPKKVKGNKN